MTLTNIYNRLLTAAVLLSTSVCAFAQNLQTYVDDTYVGMLGITIDGIEYNHADITLYAERNASGTVNVSVKDFTLVKGEESKPLGSILLGDLTLAKGPEAIRVSVSSTQTAAFTDGKAPSPDDPVNPSGGGNNSVSGGDQGAEGEWGDGTGQGGDDKHWLGATYGQMDISVSGELTNGYADLKFVVTIPSVGKTVTAVFRTPNVSTSISPATVSHDVRSGLRKFSRSRSSRRYTLSGTPAPANYRGVVIE